MFEAAGMVSCGMHASPVRCRASHDPQGEGDSVLLRRGVWRPRLLGLLLSGPRDARRCGEAGEDRLRVVDFQPTELAFLLPA